MTDIPFVDRLGDALEAAIAEPLPSRLRLRSRRKVFVLAVFAAAALAVAALAVAHVLSSPDQLATTGIACYASADLSSDVTVVPNDRAPVAACADAFRRLGQSVPPLVACANGSSIAVIPATDRGVCARVGLEPLPLGYALARAKVSLLAEAVRALEARRDCLAPDTLARGVEHLLFVQGWQGWTAEVQSRPAGPCGSVTGLGGGGRRSIEGALDAGRRVVLVSGTASRSTIDLLYGQGRLAPRLEDESGARCFSIAELTALVQSRAGNAGRAATIELAPPLPSTTTLADARQQRYQSGCAVITDVHAASDGRDVVAVIPRPVAHSR